MVKNSSSLPPPKTLHLELGLQCNIRCLMCYQFDYKQKMNPKIWRDKLLSVYPSVSRLLLQGGEITMIPEAKQLMELALSVNPKIKFGAMTNGLMFSEFWQKFFASHGYMVNFSLNGANSETHEIVNKYSNFNKVVNNINGLIAHRQQTQNELEICASYVILPQNIHQLAKFISVCIDIGIDTVRFFFDAASLVADTVKVKTMVEQALVEKKNNLKKIKVEGLLNFYRYYCQKKKIKNAFQHEKEEAVPAGICKLPWENIFIDHQGRATLCCMSNLTIGDLNKQKVEDIWMGRQANKFRKAMQGGDYRYCQPTCLLNKKASIRFTLANTGYYLGKFTNTFLRSPKTAIKKATRKIKQMV